MPQIIFIFSEIPQAWKGWKTLHYPKSNLASTWKRST